MSGKSVPQLFGSGFVRWVRSVSRGAEHCDIADHTIEDINSSGATTVTQYRYVEEPRGKADRYLKKNGRPERMTIAELLEILQSRVSE